MRGFLTLTLTVKSLLLTSLGVFLAFAVFDRTLLLAGGAKCQDIPLQVTIYNNAVDPVTGATTPSAIQSDGGGVYSASIKCGTNDAVLNLGGTKRTFEFFFPIPIAGSVIQQSVPKWVPGVYATSGWINVRNITFSKQPFATMAGSTFRSPWTVRPIGLGFKGQSPDLPNAPNLDDPGEDAGRQHPLPSSSVIVYPTYPTVCGAGSMPTWHVWATSPNSPGTILTVSTLHKMPSNPHGTEVPEGQYTMPFEMLIEATQCFSY